MDKKKQFENRLRAAGERITSPRLTIFNALLRKSPIRPTELVELLRGYAIDPATTYRNVNLFRELNIIRDIVAGGQRLIELSDDYESHHHHFWCRQCGKLIDFDSPDIEKSLNGAITLLGGVITSHHVEISGLCKDCC